MRNGLEEIRAELGPHLSRLRVAVYGSGGAPPHHLALLALWGAAPAVLYADEIRGGELSSYDAVIFPGGGLAAMAGHLGPLGAEGVSALRRWLEAGGSYLGSCAGSCHPLRMGRAYNEAHPEAVPFQVCDVTPLNAAAGPWGLDSPGTGRLEVAPETHPLFEGLSEPFEIVHYNGPLFPAVPGAAGRVLGGAAAFTPFESSHRPSPGEEQGSSYQVTTLGRAVVRGARVAYHGRVGAGQVILFGSHPEFGGSALQLGWLPAARLLANALGVVRAGSTPPSPPASAIPGAVLRELGRWAGALASLLTRAAPLKARLPASVPPFLGRSGPDLWDAALAEARGLLAALERWAAACPTGRAVRGAHLLDQAPRPGQDVGFMGACQLLGRALELAQKAVDPATAWPAFTGAYDQLETHPYHLLVGSYLSACGSVAAAALQVTALGALNDLPLAHPIPLTGD